MHMLNTSWTFIALSFALLAPLHCGQEELRLTATDGQPLSATLTLPAQDVAVQGAVVLLPMLGSSRSAFTALLPRLNARGLVTLALDPRGHGASSVDASGQRIQLSRTGSPTHPARFMELDVAAALAHLKSLGFGAERCVLLGAELGAISAVRGACAQSTKPAALVLLSPLKGLCGLDAEGDAKQLASTRCLIVAASEEAELGAKSLKEAWGAAAELRLVEEKGVLGTRMFGRVANLEDDLGRWIEESLQNNAVLDVPLVRGQVLDGELGTTEDEGSKFVQVSLAGASRPARIRIARNRSRLIIGADIPERFLSHNSFTVLIDGSGLGPAAPDARCVRLTIKPEGSRAVVEFARGSAGGWIVEANADLQGAVRTNLSDAWSAELSLPLVSLGTEEGREVRLAFGIHGQKKESLTFHPRGVDMDLMPRKWLRAKVR
jgi:pimeloyl-ACP methyl ester carboxylesterase